jgi:hypothetical protein
MTYRSAMMAWIILAFCDTTRAAAPPPVLPDYALAKPIFEQYFVCGEHRQGELTYLGDALGADCFIQRMEVDHGLEFARAYRGSGVRNEDWYGWKMPVLSPCDCRVVKTVINPIVNVPGQLGQAPATFVVLKRSDGVHFLLAHLAELMVKPGQQIAAGQKLGVVGNNGYGRSPHIHIGAWRQETPLQIRFDLGR